MATQHLLPLPEILREPPPRLSCSACSHAKLRPRPHHPTTHHYDVAVVLSSDVCGPITPKSSLGNSYFFTLIDTHSRYALVSFMPSRKAVHTYLQAAIRVVENLHGHIPRILTTDNAKDYISHNAHQLYEQHDITNRATVPHKPQENGIAERFNATICAAARSALYHSNLPTRN